MAVGNGNDMTQDTTTDDVQQQTFMMVYGTGEFYNGLTVMVGGYHYTTVGGALEGNSLQLMDIPQELLPEEDNNQLDPTQSLEDRNPVVELFQAPATPRYRRSDNNLLVPIGTPLHRHADDTIMTEHGMGPQDNSVVVFQILDDEIGEQADNETNQQQQGDGEMDSNIPIDTDFNQETNQGGGGNYGN